MELLARRQGQLRRRPGRRGPVPGHLPRHRRGRPGHPGVHGPCRAVPGRGGGHPEFLDIGTGLPTADSTHEIAQQVAPESRIVYVDNDPVVLLHAHALLRGTAQGVTDYVDADLRDPGAIIAAAAKTLDLTQPVAVMFLGVLGHVTEDGQAQSIGAR